MLRNSRLGISEFLPICLAGILLVLGLCFLWLEFFPAPAPVSSFERVRDSFMKSDALLLDRHGEVIHELRVDKSRRQLEWTPLNEVSPALISAVISAEDKRFYRHRGVDWLSFASALVGVFHDTSARGASTITMQLVSRLNPALQPKNSRRSLAQKGRQIRTAWAIEREWSKDQILEAYLNLVTFRGELQGIAAAARGLFEKNPHGLDHLESLILASLIRSPNASAETVTARAGALSDVLGFRFQHSSIASAVTETLSKPYFVPPQAALAPHVALRLLAAQGLPAERTSRRLRCTLDGGLQAFATETLRQHLVQLGSQNMHDGAVMVADNGSGDVLAYVGNSGDQGSARYVDGILAPRQAGSTLKPFVYGLAFDRRLLTPASLLEDSALDIPVLGGIYRPRNYDNRFHGLVTARTALASSLNVPAVRTLNLVGVEQFTDCLTQFGIRNLRRADFYGPSLALGAADITLWDLVGAYRSLANGGVYNPMRLTFDAVPAPTHRILSDAAAFLVSDILSDRESRNITFSLESPLSTRFWTAVKTGTSKDMRDNWCVGFSSRYTVGVWTGNFSGEPMWNVSGVTGAAPVWIDIMNYLHRSMPSTAPLQPPDVVRRRIQVAATGETRQEVFLAGTDAVLVQEASNPDGARIVCPVSGAVIAVDPDIPRDQQRLFFEARPADALLKWNLDGQVLGAAGSIFLWSPVNGKHILSLADQNNRVLDSVQFEVRGGVAGEETPH